MKNSCLLSSSTLIRRPAHVFTLVLVLIFLSLHLSPKAEAQSAGAVTRIDLINADTDLGILSLSPFQTIDLATLPTRNLGIRAITSPSPVGSVQFSYDTIQNARIENYLPYSIRGDVAGDFPAWTPALGQHTITVTPFSLSAATGTTGTAMSVTFTVVDTSNSVSVQPAEIKDTIIANPGMGLQSGDRVEADGIDAQGFIIKVAYYKLYWKNLEKSRGVFDFSSIDQNLSRARASGQKLALRVVTFDDITNGPLWLQSLGVSGFNVQYVGSATSSTNPTVWSPNIESLKFQAEHSAFISQLGARYNGHPDIDSIDIGSVGLWGEWNYWGLSPKQAMPSTAAYQSIINDYTQAFPNTPLVMQLSDAPSLTYAISKGTGYRGDCLGFISNQMFYTYPDNIAAAHAENAWKKAPINFEACWTVNTWVSKGLDIKYIVDWALQHHISGFNNKNSPIPSAAMPQIQRLLVNMGYRYVMRSLRHPKTANDGATINLSMQWDNKGVAPTYGNYVLGIQLRNSAGTVVNTIATANKAKTWLPGANFVDQSFVIPLGLPAGPYTIALALVDPTSKVSAIRLATAGRDSTGWYPLSSIEVL